MNTVDQSSGSKGKSNPLRSLSVMSLHEMVFSKNDFLGPVKSCISDTDFIIKEYNIMNLGNLKSFFGKYGKLRVETEIEGRIQAFSFLIQSTKRRNPNIIVTNASKGYGPEKFIYFLLLPHFRQISDKADYLPIAECYYVKDEIAIFENILQSNFICTGHYDHEHNLLVLQSIASFHSMSLLIEAKANISMKALNAKYFVEPIYFRENDKNNFQFFKVIVHSLVGHMEQIRRKKPTPEKIMNFFLGILAVMNDPNKVQNVWCHGNLFEKTIFFRYDKRKPADCKFINFLLTRYAPPAYDVVHFLVFCSDNDTRYGRYGIYLNNYYETLAHKCLENDFNINDFLTFQEFETTCKVYLDICKFIKILYDIYNSFLRDIQTTIVDSRGFNQDLIIECLANNEEEVNWRLDDLSALLDGSVLSTEDIHDVAREQRKGKSVTITNMRIEQLLSYAYSDEHSYHRLFLSLKEEQINDVHYRYFIKKINYQLIGQHLDTSLVTYTKSRKEYFFYLQYLKDIKTYDIDLSRLFARCMKARQNDVMVFEELGYDYEKFADYEQNNLDTVKMILQKLAEFHGSTVVFEHKMSSEVKSTVRLPQKYESYLTETVFSTNPECKKLFEATKRGIVLKLEWLKLVPIKVSQSKLKQKLDEFCDQVYEATAPSKIHLNVLCHGCLWQDNIICRKQGGEIADIRFIDLDCYRYNTPGQDLMIFLYLGTDRQFRESHLSSIQEFYYECLKKHLRKYDIYLPGLMSYDEFLINCEDNIPFALIFACYILHVSIETYQYTEIVNEAGFVKKTPLYETTIDFISNFCHSNKEYCKRLHDLMTEFAVHFKRNIQ